MHDLSFDLEYEYDINQSGTTLPVKIKYFDQEVDFEAKIDTGSTNCIFARQIGEQLGLNIENALPKRINTVTGSFLTYEHNATMEILNCEFSSLVCFAEDNMFQNNVLGRFGFLQMVRIAVIDYEGKIYLSKYDD